LGEDSLPVSLPDASQLGAFGVLPLEVVAHPAFKNFPVKLQEKETKKSEEYQRNTPRAFDAGELHLGYLMVMIIFEKS
jgi:hypothetical protein